MSLEFAKMHGLGNDFVVIDAINQEFRPDADLIRRLADRHLGVGCDQVLVVEAADRSGFDFHYRIFNADGDEIGQCGNGARCFARFVVDRGLSADRELRVSTNSGPLQLTLLGDHRVRVNMGEPGLEPAQIPLLAEKRAATYELDLDGLPLRVGAVSMGNPHLLLQVGDVDTAPVLSLGPRLEHHPRLPQRANVGFMEILNRDHLRLRVFERGVGETRACGSGACAALVCGRLQGLLDARATVALPGGMLEIEWQGEGHHVMMTGPAIHVFDGQIDP